MEINFELRQNTKLARRGWPSSRTTSNPFFSSCFHRWASAPAVSSRFYLNQQGKLSSHRPIMLRLVSSVSRPSSTGILGKVAVSAQPSHGSEFMPAASHTYSYAQLNFLRPQDVCFNFIAGGRYHFDCGRKGSHCAAGYVVHSGGLRQASYRSFL